MEELRSRALDSQRQTSDEASEREAMLREAQEDLERLRMQMEEWETEAMRERTRRETAETRMSQLEVEATNLGSEIERIRMERDREAESAANLHLVLEEFQTGELTPSLLLHAAFSRNLSLVLPCPARSEG